jgi:hypothetical protein
MSPRVVRVVLGLCAAILVARCVQYRGSLIDDAYIVFRYADNLLAGLGPVFNAGERVEGFTSPLWLVLLAAAKAVGVSYETAVFVLGTVCAAAALFPAYALARRVAPGAAALAAPLLLCVHPGFAMWSVHGLETSLFALLVTSAVWAVERRPAVAGVLTGLAFWTRPEGALWAVALTLFMLARGRRRDAVALSAGFLFLALPIETARILYYGAPFPNTYYAKQGGGLGRLGFGIDYAKTFVYAHALVIAACLPAAWAARKREQPLLALCCLLGAVWTAYVVWEGGDAFPGYRFWIPVLPLAAALVSYTLSLRPPSALALGIVIAAVTAVAARADVRIEHVTGREFTAKMIRAGEWLREHAPAGTWVAVNYVGALPYYSGLPTIDMLGLTDVAIAHTPIRGPFRFPGHAKGNGASVLDRKPGLILMGGVSLGPKLEETLRTELASEDEIAADPRFEAEYERVAFEVPGADGPAWFEFYKRRELTLLP